MQRMTGCQLNWYSATRNTIKNNHICLVQCCLVVYISIKYSYLYKVTFQSVTIGVSLLPPYSIQLPS